jgi:diadenosine tetraphosphatase ApaH/serine/threonine PP2A family protein phosphatase
MRYAIFSDIHANLEALEAVLARIDEIAQEEPIDQLWFLGDLVGYGPDPNECIRVLRERTDVIIAGNHDWAAVGKIDLEDFSAAARVSAEWTAEQLTPEYREFLAHLPERLEFENCTLVHGSPFGPLWEYLTSEALAERSFLYFDTRYCLVGHTHVPVIFVQPDAANIPTSPLEESDITAPGSANGAGHHHEQAAEEGAAAEEGETGVAAGETGAGDDDETVELVTIQSQGQQTTLSGAHVEPAASVFLEPHSAPAPSDEAPAPAHEESDGSPGDGAPTDDDDDETGTAFSLAQDDAPESEEKRERNAVAESTSDDEAEELDDSPDILEEFDMFDYSEIEGEGDTDGNHDDVSDAGGAEDSDRPGGRTPESEVESAEERLTSEIEELLNLLGLSQSMVQVTNQMLTPPEGHWEAPPEHRAIINPGGVGQPRDGDPRAAFMIYDTERGFEFYRTPYDFEKTQEKIIQAGLPHFLAVRLAYGR